MAQTSDYKLGDTSGEARTLPSSPDGWDTNQDRVMSGEFLISAVNPLYWMIYLAQIKLMYFPRD